MTQEVGFLPLIAGIASLVLAGLVYFGGRTVHERRAFTLFAFSMGAWALGISGFLFTSSLEGARTFAEIYYVAALLLIYGFLLFSLDFLDTFEQKKHVKNRLEAILLIPVVLLSIAIFIPNTFIQSIIFEPERVVLLQPVLYQLFCIVFTAYGVGALLALGRKKAHPKNKRNTALRLVTLVMYICLPAGAIFNLVLPFFGNYQWIAIGPVFALPIVITTFYAIMRHSLFDVKLAFVRTLAYGLSISTLAALYYLIAYALSTVLFASMDTSLSPMNIAIALVIAFMFQPIKVFFDRTTSTIFYKDNYSSDEFFSQLSRTLASTTDLDTVLARAGEKIASTLKAEAASFVVSLDSRKYIIVGNGFSKHIADADAEQLTAFVERSGSSVIIRDLIPENDSIRRLLISYRAALILPLNRGKSIDFLLLGEQKSGAYTHRDVQALYTIRDEIVIAIQNALSVREIKKLNETLNQRIDSATKELRTSNAQLQRLDEAKDEFISMASHQLRTPLTSVKGYLSMVLEGDAGKINSNQKHLLNEAFTSSERMVHLINDFLNVSRLQTGKFIVEKRPTDIVKLVEQEVDSLRTTANAHGLKISYHAPSESVTAEIDEGKIRQVVMNFVDNAIYYSKSHTTIQVSLQTKANWIELTVKDTGIGVPEAEKVQLFAKFFRASNARKQRPDGTGVGLFLARKVIVAHGGETLFDSKEGKGSVFGFRLPIQ